MTTTSKKYYCYLSCIITIGFILRILFYKFILNSNPICGNDSLQYLDVAFNIQNNFSNQLFGMPNFLRLPGYPAIIAFFSTIFSSELFIYIQIFFSALIPVIVYFLTSKIFGNKQISFLTAALVTFNIGFILYSGLILTETFFIFFLSLFFLSFIKANSKSKYLLSGILIGLTSLIRPIGIFVLPICFFYIFFKNQKSNFIFVFFIAWLATISPLLIHNYNLAGHVFMHTLTGDHFLCLSAAQVVAKEKNINLEEAKKELLEQIKISNSEIENCLNKEKLAKETFLKYPIYFHHCVVILL